MHTMGRSAKLLFAGDVCFDVQPEVDAALSRRILAGVKRDLLSYEAHNELLRTTLDIAFSGELEEAITNREKILELQRMPIVD